MARKLIEYKVSDADIVSYSGYNSTKTVLGPMIYKFTGSSVNDYYIGPPDMKWRNITQDVGYSYFNNQSVTPYTDELDLILITYNFGSSNPFRVVGYFFNKLTGVYTYLGLINAPTHINPTATTWSRPRATIDFYTAGTVSVSGNTVIGLNTDWGDNQICAGNRIGFGSTNSKDITNWYEIKSVPLETNRFNNSVTCVEVDSSGSVYMGGTFTTYTYLGSAYTSNRIIKLNPDGSPDFTFNVGAGFNGVPRRIKIDPLDSSKIYIGGDFSTYSGVTVGYLTKLNKTTGAIDSNWDLRNMAGANIGFNTSVYDIDFDSNGKIFTTGLFTSYVRSGTTVTTTRLCRLLPNGNLDTTFSGYTTGLVYSIAPASSVGYCVAVDKSNDEVYVGGLINSWNGNNVANAYNIIKINVDGSIDRTFGITGGTYFNNYPYSITYDTFNGGIYVGGAFTLWSGLTNNYMVKLTSGGTKDTSFDNTLAGGFATVSGGGVSKIKLTNDNKVYVNGYFLTYRGNTYNSTIKLNTDGSIDTGFNPETRTTGLDWYTGNLTLGDTFGINNSNNSVYFGLATSNSTFGGMIAYTSGGTIDENFYGKNTQQLTLTTSATTYSAGTAYVIEDLRIYFGRSYNNTTVGGLYSIKGIKISDFVTGTTQIGATTNGYYGLQARTSYFLPPSLNTSGVYVYIYDVILDDKTDWNNQIGYSMFYNNLALLQYNLRQRYRLTSSSTYVYPDGFKFATSTFDTTMSNPNNGLIATTKSGSGAGVKSIYHVRPTGVRQIPMENLISGVNPISLVNTQFMAEVPPGNTTTYPASSSLLSINYMPEIDRFIITTGAAPFKAYITNFNASFSTPSLSSTLWSRDLYNTLSYDNSFEKTFLVDSRQLQGTLSDTRAPKYPDPQGTYFIAESKNGWTHLIRQAASSENIMYSIPIAADADYVSVSNNVFITPKYVIPNLISITGFYINNLKQIGSGVFSQAPEPIFIDFRTSGIDDNSGSWTNFNNVDQLNTLLCNNTTNNITIQFRFRFRVAGINCNPNRLYGFTFTYEDDTTDSHYLPSVSKSNLTSRIFAWQQNSLFNGNIPNMKIRVYNAENGNILLYDTVTDSKLGTWQYSTDGNTWNTWSSSADTVGNYIRYTANYLPSNYKLRVGLNQV